MQFPSTSPGILLVLGAVFLLIAVVGGGFEVSALKLPPIGRYQRVFALLAGITLITLGVRSPGGESTPDSRKSPPRPGAPPAESGFTRPGSQPPESKPPPRPAPEPHSQRQKPQLRLKSFHATSEVAQHPEVRVTVPAGYKIISGGARVDYQGSGNLLTASYPEGTSTWVARSKDHQEASPAQIEAWAVALNDPNNEWDVRTVSATSSPAEHPTASVTLPDGYSMTGGGAQANWAQAGSLLTASYPEGADTWVAKSKDHLVPEVTTLTIYVIGIRPTNGSSFPSSIVFHSQSGKENHPSATVRIRAGYLLVGGGAQVDWEGAGNLLTASYPDGKGGWTAASKDHVAPDPAVIEAYALGVPQ
jgi:hypothetical protein